MAVRCLAIGALSWWLGTLTVGWLHGCTLDREPIVLHNAKPVVVERACDGPCCSESFVPGVATAFPAECYPEGRDE